MCFNVLFFYIEVIIMLVYFEVLMIELIDEVVLMNVKVFL